MNDNLEFFKKLLDKNGYKLTSGKAIVLKSIMESNTHLNVREIYERVKKEKVSLATVYRALNLFADLSIVKEINVNGTSYYEMRIFSGNPLHIHFKCSKCNSIIDIDSKALNLDYLKLNDVIEKDNELEIHDTNIMFSGICKKCIQGIGLDE